MTPKILASAVMIKSLNDTPQTNRYNKFKFKISHREFEKEWKFHWL
jgi:hypothetical protein